MRTSTARQVDTHPESPLKIQKILRTQEAVAGFAQLPNGRVAFATWEGMQIWNTHTGKREKTLAGHHRTLVTLNDGSLADAVGCKIQIWNTQTHWRNPEKILTSPINEDIVFLAVMPSGWLLSQSCVWGGKITIKLWDTVSGTCEKTLTFDPNDMGWLAVLSDSRLASKIIHNGDIKIWNLDTGACEKIINDNERYLITLRDGRLASGSREGIKIWNANTGSCEKTLRLPTGSWVTDLLELSDGRLMSSSCDSTVFENNDYVHHIEIWNLESEICEKKIKFNCVLGLFELSDGSVLSARPEVVKILDLGIKKPVNKHHFFSDEINYKKFYEKLENHLQKAESEPYNDEWSYKIYFLLKKNIDLINKENIKNDTCLSDWGRVINLFKATHAEFSKHGTHSPYELLNDNILPNLKMKCG